MGEGANRGKKGKGHQGTCVKHPWTKQRGLGLRVGVDGAAESRGRKMETIVLE